MNRKLFLYIVFFVLTVTFVIAAMGGGGGGSGSSSSSSSSSGGGTVGVGSSGGRQGPYFYGLECFDTGQLTFKQSPSVKPAVVGKERGANFTIFGEWKGTIFTSEEAEIINGGTYIVYDSYNGNKKVECPGLKFSCKLVKIDVQECFYEESKILVRFKLMGKGASADELRFKFQKSNSSQVLEYQKNTIVSSALKDVQLQNKGNNIYTLEVTGANLISRLEVTYPKCMGKYYVRSKINCTKKEESPHQEEVIEKKENEAILNEVIKDKEIEKQEGKSEGKQKEDIFLKTIFFFKKWFLLD